LSLLKWGTSVLSGLIYLTFTINWYILWIIES